MVRLRRHRPGRGRHLVCPRLMPRHGGIADAATSPPSRPPSASWPGLHQRRRRWPPGPRPARPAVHVRYIGGGLGGRRSAATASASGDGAAAGSSASSAAAAAPARCGARPVVRCRIRFCDVLGLGRPGRAVDLGPRSRTVAEFGSVMAMICATLGKIGQRGAGAAAARDRRGLEPFTPGRWASITMPHKRNPERSEHS